MSKPLECYNYLQPASEWKEEDGALVLLVRIPRKVPVVWYMCIFFGLNSVIIYNHIPKFYGLDHLVKKGTYFSDFCSLFSWKKIQWRLIMQVSVMSN